MSNFLIRVPATPMHEVAKRATRKGDARSLHDIAGGLVAEPKCTNWPQTFRYGKGLKQLCLALGHAEKPPTHTLVDRFEEHDHGGHGSVDIPIRNGPPAHHRLRPLRPALVRPRIAFEVSPLVGYGQHDHGRTVIGHVALGGAPEPFNLDEILEHDQCETLAEPRRWGVQS